MHAGAFPTKFADMHKAGTASLVRTAAPKTQTHTTTTSPSAVYMVYSLDLQFCGRRARNGSGTVSRRELFDYLLGRDFGFMG